jgi:pimeloyl-ACP methyl ester carboxylesterase
MDQPPDERRSWLPFLAGVLAGGAAAALAYTVTARRRAFDPRLLRFPRDNGDVTPAVLVPGIMGSHLRRPDGIQAWLAMGNTLGRFDLGLPSVLPLSESRDDLVAGGLLGAETVLPRLFGFTEYADLLELLEVAGFRREGRRARPGAVHHIFAYDWRRDLVESARRLHEMLEALAESRGDPDARFNIIGHSMGGLVARYYLRYGTAEPDGPVTWAGARRIRNLVLVAVPNSGGIPALDAILNGNRVGLSFSTLAAGVVSRMPSIYQLLPPAGAAALIDHQGHPVDADLHAIETWQRFGWGPFRPSPARRREDPVPAIKDVEAQKAFLEAVLTRARDFHRALVRPPQTPCPARVVVLGGDCLPTLACAVVSEKPGMLPRFEPFTSAESRAMFEAGDGRVTRASSLASYLPGADDADTGSGLPEVSLAFFGSADHHGIYREPTFQSILLRILLRPPRRADADSRAASA